MTIVDIGDGYVRITCPGGKVMDQRTGRKYRAVVCKAEDIRHFAEA